MHCRKKLPPVLTKGEENLKGCIVGVLVVIFAIAGIVALVTHKNDSNIRSSSGTYPSATTPDTSFGTVAEWAAAGVPLIQQIHAATDAMGAAASARSVAAERVACGELVTAVIAARAIGEIPRASAQAPWGRALDEYYLAGSGCRDGTDAASLSTAADHLAAGNIAIHDVTTALGQP